MSMIFFSLLHLVVCRELEIVRRQRGGAEASHPVLLATEKQTWQAAQEIAGMTPDILPSSARKIEEAKVLHVASNC